MKEGESVASPKLLLVDLFTTRVIDAYEGIEVYIFDVPIAYLNYDVPNDNFIFNLRGNFVDIMCQINPEHNKNVRYKNM